MTDFIDTILREQRIGYAIFDRDLMLKQYSRNFPTIIQQASLADSCSIWDIFPELFGSEDQIEAVQRQKQRRFQLEKINKYSPHGQLHYYDLTILPLNEPPNHLLTLVADSTKEASLQQHIRQQKFEIEMLQASLAGYGGSLAAEILGESDQIKRVRAFVQKIAPIRNTTILLYGESGTGKNLVARAIHRHSLSSSAPFVEVNCASIPATLLESEIFGHEKGAFTNAIVAKKGLLEEADGGTFFLDEIGELPFPLQAKFLSFLESHTFRRLGSTQERRVDIRVIAATNKDLKEAVAKNEFRQDLFFRINVINLTLPPLRELGNDIIIIADHFIRLFAFDFKKKVSGLTPAAQQRLLKYHWPGNVRELRNVIERAVIFAEHDRIDANEIILSEDQQKQPSIDPFRLTDSGLSLEQIEKQMLTEALMRTHGNQTRAAKLLGISLDTLRYRIKKYQIPR
ncbi:MAG: sigma 54-interacting transcriptional regulator [candidate division KSB1 bacterium]|nr:sigma 54-interacting transcriptional regulator [candidate division KSB1 bacterium]MDZ7333655.1 sigma 54-interacting transcriptional regulator [candidate division KSB1 bacterium]MDZ7356103.1 sigma 54-interacting transcriptional regulator [candidate division KSB1 bacterium]MDZ7376600.1 sigma 54-interacting transcriptional regulator [candidate division KSB1 bacterium]MDZ7398920.1 sigma 54-interacting transcriptional regulator [candidate division KSB1 bacterium]